MAQDPLYDQRGEELLLEAYIEAWTTDISEGLREDVGRTARKYKAGAVVSAIAGCMGLYDDPLINLAAAVLGLQPSVFWFTLYCTGLEKARNDTLYNRN